MYKCRCIFSYSFSLLQLLRKLFINLDLLETFSHFAFPPFLIYHLLLLINCLLFAFVFISLWFFLHSIYFWTGFSLIFASHYTTHIFICPFDFSSISIAFVYASSTQRATFGIWLGFSSSLFTWTEQKQKSHIRRIGLGQLLPLILPPVCIKYSCCS